MSKAERIIQMGVQVTEGLGAGSQPDVGRAAAEEVIDEIRDHLPVRTWCSSPPAWAAAPARRCAGDRAGRQGARHPHGRRGHQAVPLRGPAPHEVCGIRHRRTAEVRRHPDHHPEPESVPGGERKDDLRRRLRHGGPGALFRRRLHHRPDGEGRPDQPRLCRRARDHARNGQGDDGHRRGLRREARAALGRSCDRKPADRRRVDEGRPRPADLDHRRQGPHALRGRRGRHPHPRGGRPGGQHHRRRDLRRKPRRHHPRFGGGDRHRLCRKHGPCCRPKIARSSPTSCASTPSALLQSHNLSRRLVRRRRHSAPRSSKRRPRRWPQLSHRRKM